MTEQRLNHVDTGAVARQIVAAVCRNMWGRNRKPARLPILSTICFAFEYDIGEPA